MSKGEYRVGIDFNPSGNTMVKEIKRQAANMIDTVDGIEAAPDSEVSEVERLKSLAQTHIEDAAMWAVKAATKRGTKE